MAKFTQLITTHHHFSLPLPGDVFLIEPPASVSPRPGSSPLSQKRTIVSNQQPKKRSSMPETGTITQRNRSCSEPSVDTMGLNRHSGTSLTALSLMIMSQYALYSSSS